MFLKLYLSALLSLFLFTIGSAQPKLIPLTPDPTYNRNPTLSWNSVAAATEYKIELDNDISFATPIVSKTTSGSTNFTVSTPLSDGHYYWRVSSNLDYSLFSDIDDFVVDATAIPKPAVIPVSPDPISNPIPTLSWQSVPLAKEYKIELDDDISFATPIVSTTTSGSTNFTVPAPLSSGHYYWHVSSDLDYSLFSDIDDFLENAPTVIKPTVIPVSPDPATNPKPTLSWNRIQWATKYKIELDDDISFASPIVSTTISGDTCFTLHSQLPNGRYYWRVSSNLDYSLFSDPNDFEVIILKPTITPVSPDTCRNPSPTFSWNSVPSATNYKIELDDDISFATPIVSTTTSGATNFSLGNRLPNGHYFWHVSSSLDYTLFSDPDDFFEDAPPAVKPTPVTVIPDSSDNYNPILTWNEVPMATAYFVQLSKDTTFAVPIISLFIPGSTNLHVSNPLAIGTYYWRVSSNLDYSLYSQTSSFVLEKPTSGLSDKIHNRVIKTFQTRNMRIGMSYITIPEFSISVNILITSLTGKKLFSTKLQLSDVKTDCIQSKLSSRKYIAVFDFFDKKGLLLGRNSNTVYLSK